MHDDRPSDWDDPVGLPTITAPTRLLVPFDGSHNAERALAWAALVSRAAQAEVIVLVAFEQPLTMRGRGAMYIETVRNELEAEAVQLATESVQLLQAQGVTARGVIVKGDAARAVLDTAETEGADMIVLGRHGLTHETRGMGAALDRFRDLLQGGVTQKVTGHAPVPVLVVA